ncbi:MAG TPA: enoyl-CoA hydratase [Pseudogracilibacillus sp.]|nr:enoyl-CoA hydratase [Pseudogracilibacillus sp.]
METLTLKMDHHIAVLTIESPPANALSSKLIQAINDQLTKIEEDASIKAVILRGEGRFFSAGADIKEFTDLQSADDYAALAKIGQKVFARMENFHIPIIAAIHGAALGGGLELAMGCHMRIVSEDAKIGLPEMSLGIIPGFAGTQRLPHYVGIPKAYEIILTAEPISGKEAYQYGLANHVVQEEAVFEKAKEVAEKIASKSGPAIHRVMKLVPYAKSSQFDEGVEKEAEYFGEIFGTEDASEGIRAFIEKRKPNFKDK